MELEKEIEEEGKGGGEFKFTGKGKVTKSWKFEMS